MKSNISCLIYLILLTQIRSVFVPPKHPNYDELESLPSSALTKDEAFISACREMAGYYKDPKRDPSLRNTIVLTGVNNGYLDFLHNFKCHMDRLGIKFLPLSMDKGIYHYITENKVTTTYLLADIPGRERVAAEPSGFGGKNFNLIGCRKMEGVYAALALGYNVIFSDVDIAILQNPIQYLFLPHIDYVHSTNKGCRAKWTFNETMEGNTGFYSAVSNPQTIRTWDLTYKACARAPLYDDQTMFWLILRTNQHPLASPMTSCRSISPTTTTTTSAASHSPSTAITSQSLITTCPLDDCQFSASHLRDGQSLQRLVQALRQDKVKAVAVHANWMNGKDKKKSALQQAGLWITRRPPTKDIGMTAMGSKADHQSSRNGNWSCIAPTGTLL